MSCTHIPLHVFISFNLDLSIFSSLNLDVININCIYQHNLFPSPLHNALGRGGSQSGSRHLVVQERLPVALLLRAVAEDERASSLRVFPPV